MPHPTNTARGIHVAVAAPFTDVPLSAPLRQAVRDLGFHEMTPVQAAALPPLLAGRDVAGRADTGTGKTAAFSLPLLQGLELGFRRVQALVLCPTRELVVQVTADLRALGKRSAGLRVVPVFGGQPGALQARTLGEGAHVVVGTPGRTLDHLRRGTLDLGGLRMLVLDEADRMLELGFADDMAAIRAFLPTDRQTTLFSATFPQSITELSAGWQRDPIHVEVEEVAPTIEAFAAVTMDKIESLDQLLRALQPERALVFCNFKRVVAETALALRKRGCDAAALHGDLEQLERDRVMAAFRNGSVRVLVATDVAARGLDVDGLPLVVNLELPQKAEDYTHRIGRTGRAGRAGQAWALVTAFELPKVPPGVVRAELPNADGPPLRAAWATLWLGAGRRDKLRPGDVLGALTGDCGLAATEVGKFEIHDRWAFVAVAVGAVDGALRGLARHGVKGKRVRVDRVAVS
jgi:ATP-dependent RNA helicase DbpA